MENTKAAPKLDIVEMAKKKRHIHLLSKMQKNQSLSKGEIEELRKYEKGSPAPGIVDSQEKVAKVFHVSTRQVRYWIKDGMPVLGDDTYDITAIQAWRILKKEKKAAGGKAEPEGWDSKFRKMKALLAEIEYKKQLGELVPRDEVMSGLIQRIIAVKTAFLSLPQTVAPQLIGLEPRQIEIILTEHIGIIIKNFSEGVPDEHLDQKGAGSVEVAGSNNGQPVGRS